MHPLAPLSIDPLAIVTGGLVATSPRRLARRAQVAKQLARVELDVAARLALPDTAGTRELCERLIALGHDGRSPGWLQELARRALERATPPAPF